MYLILLQLFPVLGVGTAIPQNIHSSYRRYVILLPLFPVLVDLSDSQNNSQFLKLVLYTLRTIPDSRSRYFILLQLFPVPSRY